MGSRLRQKNVLSVETESKSHVYSAQSLRREAYSTDCRGCRPRRCDSRAIIPQGVKAQAEIISKGTGVVAGIEEAIVLAETLGLESSAGCCGWTRNQIGTESLCNFQEMHALILTGERTILNILSRMSGIATTTRRLSEKLQKAGLKTRVAATRKTALGFLYFDKKAVMIGGGDAHRLNLDDMILLRIITWSWREV